MKIIKLRKIKLGDKYPIVRVTYKTWYGKTVERDCVKGIFHWKWADNTKDTPFRDITLDEFYFSSEPEYILNK